MKKRRKNIMILITEAERLNDRYLSDLLKMELDKL